ncbi:MAG: lipoate--protein ligase [Bacteroidales bacterium]|nr:lipoate--protein ligase [Bacteroidales bacterium]
MDHEKGSWNLITDMLCITSPNSDPYFNLASEEYFLKAFDEDVFLFYRNIPSIVVGKHQNTLAEINLPFVQENGIVVARRISGGGTVFHDLGNLNFAFISDSKEGELVDYRKFTLPIVEAMKKMGLDVRLGDRNELLLENWKISGTASHVFKKRVLHHGTLLYSADMDIMSASLKVQPERFTDRAVKSIRSEVTNIRDHLADKMDVVDFQNQIRDYILDTMDGARTYQYNDHDLKEINKLRETKFSSWEWNFGYSPKYQFNKNLRFRKGEIALHMNVVKGIIQEVNIKGDFLGTKDIHALEDVLVGTIHDPETIRMRLSGIQVADYITGMENEDLLSGMF